MVEKEPNPSQLPAEYQRIVCQVAHLTLIRNPKFLTSIFKDITDMYSARQSVEDICTRYIEPIIREHSSVKRGYVLEEDYSKVYGIPIGELHRNITIQLLEVLGIDEDKLKEGKY